MLEVLHDDVPVLFQNRKGYEQVETTAKQVGPQGLPKAKNVDPFEFAFVPNKKHAEEEEEVRRVGGLEVQVELWVHQLDQVVQGK